MMLSGCGPKWQAPEYGAVRMIANDGGPTLGYSTESGVQILTVDRWAFKDLNRNGQLDPYEDWRLSAEDRARDLDAQMSSGRGKLSGRR